MNHRQTDDSESRFAGYVEGLASVIGHKDREGPLRDYCTGLLMPCERKSVEPMAAITAPHRTAAQHQSLLHFIGEGKWSDEKVLAKVREMVVPQMQRHGAIEAWIIDDTGFPKQGEHSVGVARQYCGQLGKQDNCQVAVSLSLANHHASLPVAYQLYLPQDWAQDRERRRKVGIPEVVEFKTKPEIALEQLRWAHEAGLPRGVALLDAGYGNNTALRDGITALEMPYAVGISATTTVWAPGTAPLPAATLQRAVAELVLLPLGRPSRVIARPGPPDSGTTEFTEYGVRVMRSEVRFAVRPASSCGLLSGVDCGPLCGSDADPESTSLSGALCQRPREASDRCCLIRSTRSRERLNSCQSTTNAAPLASCSSPAWIRRSPAVGSPQAARLGQVRIRRDIAVGRVLGAVGDQAGE